MAEKKPEVTFQLIRVEDLSESDRLKVDGLKSTTKKGLIIKEYKSGSFVKLRRFIPKNNSFISQLREGLNLEDRRKITTHINSVLGLQKN